jgi:serine protease Do
MNAVSDLQETIEQTVARAGAAVVGLGRGWHAGSGVVVGRGSVLTAAHNIRGERADVIFGDGRHTAARVAALDAERDLALLSVDTGDISPVEWREQPAVAIGVPVVALSSPGGRGLRATLGFVSSADRSFRGPQGRRIVGCIEHTAPLPRGSSGSPLLDVEGRLLGLNAIRLEGGLIVAVPAAETRVQSLLRGETSEPPRLGVAVAPPYVARRLRRAVGLPEEQGVLVRSVDESSAAARAGIEQGDLIVAAGDRSVDGIDALHESLAALGPRDTLELTILRGADRRQATVSFDGTSAREEASR